MLVQCLCGAQTVLISNFKVSLSTSLSLLCSGFDDNTLQSIPDQCSTPEEVCGCLNQTQDTNEMNGDDRMK